MKINSLAPKLIEVKKSNYLFESNRLGFRNWTAADIGPMYHICKSPKVMRYFPKVYDYDDAAYLVKRMREVYEARGYCYFAVELLESRELIGFIGLNYVTESLPFAPFTDIGWRLSSKVWNKGLATEGAERCLAYAFETLGLHSIYSIASTANIASINVMKKIGMSKIAAFRHPALEGFAHLDICELYKKERPHRAR